MNVKVIKSMCTIMYIHFFVISFIKIMTLYFGFCNVKFPFLWEIVSFEVTVMQKHDTLNADYYYVVIKQCRLITFVLLEY